MKQKAKVWKTQVS